MAVKLFFGLPGSGKTTLMAYFAKKATSKHSPYNNVYCNVGLAIPGVIQIDNDYIGKYDISDGLLLIDEATLFADNRAYKDFGKDKIEFFLLHRHRHLDIYLFTQQWDAVDRKIRVITDRVFYIYKGKLLGKWFSSYYRIPYGIIIPDPNKKGGTAGEKLGEIVQGYCKPHFIVRLLAPKLYRPKYYKYFDSWEAPKLPPLPPNCRPYDKKPEEKDFLSVFRSTFQKIKEKVFSLRKKDSVSRDRADDFYSDVFF